MFANVKKYKIIKITNLQFDKFQVHILKFTSLQITKLQDYKLHVLICKFQIYKITSQFTKNKIVKLRLHVCKYAKLPNYKVTKLQIASALLHIYKFAHARFSCFHTSMYYKITKL
jgi:hypothetical protein